MSEGFTRRLEDLFAAALEIAPDQREAFVSDACGSDAVLRRQLSSLLKFHKQQSFLDGSALDDAIDLDEVRDRSHPRHLEGHRLGPYRVLRLVGEGGMSFVHLAERADQEFERQVALKIVKPGMDTGAVIRRFHAERQVLARLEHPNIARLHDGGTTDDGLPYLIMEYIEGEAITKYCDRHRLGIADRLDLFLSVCSAVRYAHTRLVLHRDIKPGNILVTKDGVPKLLDFGIARILDPESAAVATRKTQRFFTPEYASPEQVRGEPLNTATDIYSLGVVLYELLTGHLPHRFHSRSPAELEKAICEEDPTRPSTVIEQVVEIRKPTGDTRRVTPHTVAASRGLRPDRLRRRLRGDLDQIILKTLRKQPDQRYDLVEQLAEDVRRHQAGHPVLARRGTWRYVTRRFLARHKAAVATLVVLLGAGLAAGAAMIRDAQRSRQQQTALEMSGLVSDLFESSPSKLSLRGELERVIRDKGILDEIKVLRGQPEALLSVTDDLTRVCDAYHLNEIAATLREEALTARERISGPLGADLRRAHYELGLSWEAAHRYGRAADCLRRAAEIPPRDDAADEIPDYEILHALGRVAWRSGDLVSPESTLRKALDLARERGSVEEIVPLLIDLATYYGDRGDQARAFTTIRQALDLTSEPELALLRARVQRALGLLQVDSPRFAFAESNLIEAMEVLLTRLPEDHPWVIGCRDDLIRASLRGRRVADKIWTACLELRRRNFGETSVPVAESYITLGAVLAALDAELPCEKALRIFRETLGEDHPRTAEALTLLGASFSTSRTGDRAVAERHLRDALQIRQERLGPDHWKTHWTAIHLGENLLIQERFAEAESLLQSGYRRLREVLGPEHPRIPIVLAKLVALYESWERPGSAEAHQVLLKDGRSAESWSWPYFLALRSDDGKHEDDVVLDFEDDHVEKRFLIEELPPESAQARLWIYAKAWTPEGGNSRDEFSVILRVNEDPAREIRFDPARRFGLVESFRWMPFRFDLSWLEPGLNSISFDWEHDPDWEEKAPWMSNNLVFTIDMNTDEDRSWFFGWGPDCCREIVDRTWLADKPLAPEILAGHREQGFRETRGELLMVLEFLPSEW